MTFKNGLKAGAIGAVIAVLLTLIELIPVPFLGCCIFLVLLVLWAVVGVLAGYFGNQSNPNQTPGEAAQAGAVAGVITALAGGLISTIMSAIQVATGNTARAFAQLPPETWQQLRDAGIDPNTFMAGSGVGIILVTVGCCCIVGPLLAAGLGAIGGALAPSIFKRNP